MSAASGKAPPIITPAGLPPLFPSEKAAIFNTSMFLTPLSREAQQTRFEPLWEMKKPASSGERHSHLQSGWCASIRWGTKFDPPPF
ncbi:hypothetical protein LB553_06815 [Mesorhizobium sp. CA8]|nr:hypothetical protein [Mesorhizobium sp. CA8]